MPITYLNTRLISITSVALFLVAVLFFGFRRSSPSTFQQSLSGPFSSRGDLLQDVFNQTLGFQKIFVINLPSRTDHRDSMSLAAALTDLQIEYVDGVTNVDEKTLPPEGKELDLHAGGLGNWRAHMNVIRKVVEQNLTSALILEDDADWDIRLKEQMSNFAKASRLLIQPLSSTNDRFLDPSFPHPQKGQEPQDFDVRKTASSRPSTSPYGDIDRWDLLWLGHCGSQLPTSSDEKVPLGRAVLFDDETVPMHVKMQFGDSLLTEKYPAHTRLVSRAWQNACTLGYGISLPGARRFLYELSVNKLTSATDIMYRNICAGAEDRKFRNCLSVQPQLFQHHRPKGSKSSQSDISDHAAENNPVAFTRNIRWSTRVNFANLVDGTTDYIDQYKDDQDLDPDLGWK